MREIIFYDKNGVGVSSGDKVLVKHTIGDWKHYHHGIYSVKTDPITGISLKFVELFTEDKSNQYPLSSELSIRYQTLDYFYQDKKVRLVVRDTWGRNPLERLRWKSNDRSDDITIHQTQPKESEGK